MNDSEFLQAFEQCSLPENQWTHCAHVRMAWLYLHQKSLVEALPIVREGIKRFNSSLSKPLAYHETITRAHLILIDQRMKSAASVQTFDEFCLVNPDVIDRKLSALLIHYSNETLFCSKAREMFVEPDLAPFPT
jgi:hypothetical protein